MIRRPPDSLATISSQSSATPTFAPDKMGLYTFRLVATRDDGTTSITTVDLQAVARNRAVRP